MKLIFHASTSITVYLRNKKHLSAYPRSTVIARAWLSAAAKPAFSGFCSLPKTAEWLLPAHGWHVFLNFFGYISAFLLL